MFSADCTFCLLQRLQTYFNFFLSILDHAWWDSTDDISKSRPVLSFCWKVEWMLTSLSISPALCLTVTSRSVKLSNSFKPKVLECGRLIQSNHLSTTFWQILVGRIKARKSTFELKPPGSRMWAFEGKLVWSQSTVRGKLSLGKERKWDTRRWTHRETRRGKFGTETQIRVQIDRGGNT